MCANMAYCPIMNNEQSKQGQDKMNKKFTETQIRAMITPELLDGAVDCYLEINHDVRPGMTRIEVLREMKEEGPTRRAVVQLATMALVWQD